MWFGSFIVIPGQIEFHIVQDGSLFVYEVEVSWFGRSDYAHPVRTFENVQRLQDAIDLNVFGSKVFLIISVTDLTLPADGLFINTCRYGLDPGGVSLGHVSEVLVSIQGEPDVSQGALSGFEEPEFGFHQNSIMVKENEFLHRWSLSPGVHLHVIP